MEKLDMIGIRKEFSGAVANDDIHVNIHAGEILALLGENGAGKSTLMKILFGLYQPDAGEIRVDDRPVRIRSPRDSMALGIGMVHQHFMLIPNHTIAENIALSLSESSFWAPEQNVAERIRVFSDKYGFRVNPAAFVIELSAGEQQRVEILKALLQGAKLLILDEPTSVLTPAEADELFLIMKKLAADGHSIIFISHKLDEIMRISQRVLVLRRGKMVGSATTAETTTGELARMMVGRDIPTMVSHGRKPSGLPLLSVDHLVVENALGLKAVKELSFQICSGEIFGIAGVSGNGQKELVEAVTGLCPVISGSVKLDQVDITNQNPRVVAKTGVGHVPEERFRCGVVGALSLEENSLLKDYSLPEFSRWGLMDFSARKRHALKIMEEYGVSPTLPQQAAKNFSGGNIQKFIIGREMAGNPRLLVAAHPTYGVDIGAAEFIRAQLLKKRDEGMAVLLVSEDLDEVLALSDRVAVIFSGRFMGIFQAGSARREDIGLLMAGTRKGSE